MKVEMELIRRQGYQTRALHKPIRLMFAEPAATYLEQRGLARRVVKEDDVKLPRPRRGRKRKEEAQG